jgi:tetratricopeptide (TPR) repeat protein
VVRIDVDGEFAGTGFFVTRTKVLTCAHVVAGANEVTLSRAGEQHPARVERLVPESSEEVARSFYPMPDLALLDVDHEVEGQPCVRLETAAPAAGAEPDQLWLTGFTRGMHEPERVALDGAALTFEGSLLEEGWELLKLKGGQVVGGFSGSPLVNLRTGSVCGSIDSTRDPRSDLGGFAVPVAAIAAAFPGLTEENASLHPANGEWDRAVQAERVLRSQRRGEMERLPLRPPMRKLTGESRLAPSELLRPRYGLVEMIGRERLREHLMRWRESGAALGVAVITGGGGFGKTRLALEECVRAEEAGWTAGQLALDAGGGAGEELLRLARWEGPLFVAIDYAETRPDFVGPLLARLARRVEGPPVRVVLVCRQAQSRQEWMSLFAVDDSREEVLEVLEEAEPVPLAEEEIDRGLLFEAGLAAVAAGRQAAADDGPHPSLAAAHFERPLFVLAAALLRAEDPTIDVDAIARDELMLELIDRHESRYWERWNDSLGTKLARSLHGRSVAVAALLGADDEDEALSLVGAIPGLTDATEERRREVATWLGHLYGAGSLDRPPAIASIEPDMLAEALVARECGAHPELIGAALDAASDRQLARALNLLARAASSGDPVAQPAKEALDARLPSFLERISADAAGGAELTAALELAVAALAPAAGSLRAAEWLLENANLSPTLATVVFELAIDELRTEPAGSVRDELLAHMLSELSVQLGRTGRLQDAVAVGKEAIDHQRALFETSRGFLPYLAGALNNLSASLRHQGRLEESLGPAEEAIELWRQMDEDSRRLGLAVSLQGLATSLAELGRYERAVAAAAEVVDELRAMDDRDDADHRAKFAWALQVHSDLLGRSGRAEEALPPIEEAVREWTSLVRENRELYLEGLAGAQRSLVDALRANGRQLEALAPAEQAVLNFRSLAEGDRGAYLPSLVMALRSFGSVLGELGHVEAALEPDQAALEYSRELVEREGRGYLRELAASTLALTGHLASLGIMAAAVEPGEEAVRLWRELVEREGEAALPHLAQALNVLNAVYRKLGRQQDGLSAIAEAVDRYRSLAEAEPKRYRLELAGTLSNYSVAIGDVGELGKALEAADESVALFRELHAESGRHLRELAMGLNNLSLVLGASERSDDALKASLEATGYYRELIEAGENRYRRDLAQALNNQARSLIDLDRLEEAVATCREAVGLCQRLVDEGGAPFEAGLSSALATLSRALNATGRVEDARKPIEEALGKAKTDRGRVDFTLNLARWHLYVEDRERAVASTLAALKEAEHVDPTSMSKARGFLRRLRKEDEAAFDSAWSSHGEGELPVWLRIPKSPQPLMELVSEWCESPDLEASRAFLEEHAEELMTDAGEAACEHLLEALPGTPKIRFHRDLLTASRGDGIDRVFDAVAPVIRKARMEGAVAEWVASEPAESLSYMLDHEGELLDPAAERHLLDAALQSPQETDRFTFVALLGLAREESPADAYQLAAEMPELSDTACVRGAEQPRTLALARLHSGRRGGEPSSQFQHALAAAVAGEEDEAAQAMRRCRANLPSWQVSDYARRLEGIREAAGESREAIAKLAGPLGAPAGDG